MTSAQHTTPAFLTIGPASRDVESDGWQWGGTVTYAALLARAWGVSTAVLTTLAPEDVAGYGQVSG